MRRAVAIAFLLLLTCKKEDPIAGVIHAVAKAAEDRDAEAVVAYVAPGYSDENGGRREVEENLRRYFFGYRSIKVNIRDLETFRTGPAGEAKFVVDFTGSPKEIGGLDSILPSSATYRFDVWLQETDGDWKITQAQWKPEGASSN